MPSEAMAAEHNQNPLPVEQAGCTCGALRERSTTMESTTTSLQAVPSEPTTVASSAPRRRAHHCPHGRPGRRPCTGGTTDILQPAFTLMPYTTRRYGQHLLKTGNRFGPAVCMVALGRHLHAWLQG